MADPAFAQPQAFDAQGNPVAPEVAADAVARGEAFFQQGARVAARNARGEVVTVDAADAAMPGYKVLSPAEVQAEQARKQYGQGAGNVAKAAVAGAARGLTLGASDAVATAVGGDDTRRALEGLRAANPLASGAGEVAGAVAPLVLSGGASAGAQGAGLAARAGGAASGAIRTLGVGNRAIAGVGGIVERGVARGLAALGADGATAAGRIGAAAAKMGARGAAEGAMYGAAQAANDAVLKGDAITAEKIVAGMGHGALFGGALGAGIGAVARGTGELATKLVPKKEALTQLAREQAMKGAGFKGADFRKLAGRATGDAADKRLAATADDLINTTLETGPLKGQRVLQPGANVEETLTRISAAKEEAAARLSGLKDEITEGMAAAGKAPDVGAFLQRVKAEVTDPLLASKVPGVRSQVRAVQKQISTIAAEHEVRMAAAAGDEAAIAMIESGQVSAAPLFRELDRVRQDLRAVFQPVAPPGGGLPPPAPKAAAQLEKTERILADQLKQDAGAFLAGVGENPNAYNEANRLFHSFRQLEQVGTKTANQSLGNRSISPSDHALGIASFMGAMATGNVGALGAMAMGGAGALANKLLRERGNSFVADMARRAAQTDSIIESAAAALAGKADKVKTPALATAVQGKELAERYQQTAERVRELATPALAHAHISSLIPEVAAQYPDVGGAVSRKLLALYQQLSAALPKSHVDTGTTLTPLAVRERVNPAAMRKFLSTVSGTLEPEKVISDLGRGVIDRDAIEAMKLAHPETFMQLRQKVADFVQERQDELPYKRRVMLSMTFDFVGDSSLSPERMAGLQQTAQALTIQDQAQQAAMVKPKRGNGPSKIGDSMNTPNSEVFSGDM
jgi:hypothetical protein